MREEYKKNSSLRKSFLSASPLCMDTYSLRVLRPHKASVQGTKALWGADPRVRRFYLVASSNIFQVRLNVALENRRRESFHYPLAAEGIFLYLTDSE